MPVEVINFMEVKFGEEWVGKFEDDTNREINIYYDKGNIKMLIDGKEHKLCVDRKNIILFVLAQNGYRAMLKDDRQSLDWSHKLL